MKTLNLFLKMHFTSLSPDGQPISLAIVSDLFTDKTDNDSFIEFALTGKTKIYTGSRSFYAEFIDFDINRCDGWVKDNVISKLEFYPESHDKTDEYDLQRWNMCKDTSGIKIKLTKWLSQFSDYKLNFVVDCGWFTWYKFVELMGEWEMQPNLQITGDIMGKRYMVPRRSCKMGLPKLPANFPPIPQDLNDLIATKEGISVSEAFELSRKDMHYDLNANLLLYGTFFEDDPIEFNALSDVKTTKYIYNKLK